MRRLAAILCFATMSACTDMDAHRQDLVVGDVGVLGARASAAATASRTPRGLAPIDDPNANRARPSYVEFGTGDFVNADPRKQIESSDGGKTVSLNFVDVDVQEFVRVVFDEILHETVVIDPGLKGHVTVRTPAPIGRNVALDLVRQALQAANASLNQSGGIYRVTARSDQRGGRRLGESIRIVPVRYITPEDAKSALAPFSQNGVEISANPRARYVTISGAAADLDNLEQVMATLDVDQAKGMSIALLPLREASAVPVATELNQMFAKGNDQRGFRTLPITRMNSVLILSPQASTLSEARKWVSRLDRADRDGRRIYVYPVQNRRSPDVAKTLAAILGGSLKNNTQERPNNTVAPPLFRRRPSGFSREPAVTASISPVAHRRPSLLRPPAAQRRGQAPGPRVDADVATSSVVVIATAEKRRVINPRCGSSIGCRPRC